MGTLQRQNPRSISLLSLLLMTTQTCSLVPGKGDGNMSRGPWQAFTRFPVGEAGQMGDEQECFKLTSEAHRAVTICLSVFTSPLRGDQRVKA